MLRFVADREEIARHPRRRRGPIEVSGWREHSNRGPRKYQCGHQEGHWVVTARDTQCWVDYYWPFVKSGCGLVDSELVSFTNLNTQLLLPVKCQWRALLKSEREEEQQGTPCVLTRWATQRTLSNEISILTGFDNAMHTTISNRCQMNHVMLRVYNLCHTRVKTLSLFARAPAPSRVAHLLQCNITFCLKGYKNRLHSELINECRTSVTIFYWYSFCSAFESSTKCFSTHQPPLCICICI